MNVTDFGYALSLMKTGHRMTRPGWNGKGMWVALEVPEHHSKMGIPYLYLRTVEGYLVPWVPSQTDLPADDWMEFTA